MQNRNDSYFKVYKTTALQMSDFTNSMQLYVYEHAVVDLSDRYWRGQSDVNSHCSIFLTTCRNAEVQCGGEPITLKPYCFYFLPSQLRLTLVRHDHARLYHTLFRMNSWSGLDLWHLLKPHAVELNEYPPELLEKYLACARTENTPAPHDNAAISGELGLMAILYELLSLIWKAGKWELPLHNPDTLDRIERVVNFIENNPERNHPVPELARLACMSREHFTLEFRKIIGMPPATRPNASSSRSGSCCSGTRRRSANWRNASASATRSTCRAYSSSTSASPPNSSGSGGHFSDALATA